MTPPLPPQKPTKWKFTLIELLTVIGIIAFILGFFPVAIPDNIIPEKQRETRTAVRTIASALEAYKADYGHYPQVGSLSSANEAFIAVGDVKTKCSASNRELFDVLRAIPRGKNANHALNPRKVVFIETKKATDPKHPRKGIVDGPDFPEALQGAYLDPWGVEYCIVMETDNDQQLDLSSFYSDLAGPAHVVRKGAVVFSFAKDGVLGTPQHPGVLRAKPNQAPDDIISW